MVAECNKVINVVRQCELYEPDLLVLNLAILGLDRLGVISQ